MAVEAAVTGDQVAGDQVVTGPDGAIAYPAGAAYVPPSAEAWYESVLPQLRPARSTPAPLPDLPELEQIGLEPEQPPAPPPQPRRRRQACVDPGKLRSRIIAADRKAAKLEREGGAQNRKQARAIRHATATLKARLAMLEESWYRSGAEEPAPVEPPPPVVAPALVEPPASPASPASALVEPPPLVVAPALVEPPASPASALVEPDTSPGPCAELAPAARPAPLPAPLAAARGVSRGDVLTDLWQELHEYQAQRAEARGDLDHARFLRESAGLLLGGLGG